MLKYQNYIDNLRYLNLQEKIKLHFVAFICAGRKFKQHADFRL